MRTDPDIAPAALGDAGSDFASALINGLSKRSKSIPSRFLYDARGDDLFEEITQLPEYYPARAEIEILEKRASEIACLLPDNAILIELGSGSSRKTEILLERLAPRLAAYVPIDISPAALASAGARLAARFPTLDIRPLAGDFSGPLELPRDLAGKPKLCFFPGSTIGNLDHRHAREMLANLERMVRPDGYLLVGVDIKKSPSIIVPAYNDAAGVTAAFNLNLLERSNRELGTDFDPGAFRHEATYDEAAGRIDMFLISRRDQVVDVLGRPIAFKSGERIHTERSQKYDVAAFADMARGSGWHSAQAWTDRRNLFSVHLLGSRPD